MLIKEETPPVKRVFALTLTEDELKALYRHASDSTAITATKLRNKIETIFSKGELLVYSGDSCFN